ncbi:MAG: DUF1236 domain-containing protein [Alphaproteobacteria bacterium]|nr:DUF1236 domain-containing protein [Alphaproteobacteria bacterium]
MKKLLISIATASALVAGAGAALAGTTTTTTTWTTQDGTIIKKYSTTENYSSADVDMTPKVGVVLPDNVEVHALPQDIHVSQPDMYSYAIVNGQPVVVERSSRRIVHIW